MMSPLKYVLQRKLEESGIGCIALERPRARYGSSIGVDIRRGRISPTRVVQKVEHIRAKLQIVLAPDGEVLEHRHTDPVVSGTVNDVALSAEIRQHLGRIGDLRAVSGAGNEGAGQGIRERARIVPVLYRTGMLGAGYAGVCGIRRPTRGKDVSGRDRSPGAGAPGRADVRLDRKRRTRLC